MNLLQKDDAARSHQPSELLPSLYRTRVQFPSPDWDKGIPRQRFDPGLRARKAGKAVKAKWGDPFNDLLQLQHGPDPDRKRILPAHSA
jgi:hypothetical protein